MGFFSDIGKGDFGKAFSGPSPTKPKPPEQAPLGRESLSPPQQQSRNFLGPILEKKVSDRTKRRNVADIPGFAAGKNIISRRAQTSRDRFRGEVGVPAGLRSLQQDQISREEQQALSNLILGLITGEDTRALGLDQQAINNLLQFIALGTQRGGIFQPGQAPTGPNFGDIFTGSFAQNLGQVPTALLGGLASAASTPGTSQGSKGGSSSGSSRINTGSGGKSSSK